MRNTPNARPGLIREFLANLAALAMFLVAFIAVTFMLLSLNAPVVPV